MSYKIAVATSDGKQVDETFGSAKNFVIYEVTDGTYRVLEERFFQQKEAGKDTEILAEESNSLGANEVEGNCSDQAAGCGGAGGGCGSGGGCGGAGEASEKVELISDCRCVVCKKIGFHIQKQLERKAISAFDVSVSVEEALEKISRYFTRMDNHESLRK